MYAKIAARYISTYCAEVFLEDPVRMESHMANGEMIDVFDHYGGGSHKYIPADKLTEDLGQPKGAIR
jgi:hypothetical protein